MNYLGACLRERLLRDVDFRPTVVGLTCERMDENLVAYLRLGRLGKVFSRFYMRWLYFPFFDHHIAISEATADELRSACRGHCITRAVLVRGLGADLRTFSPLRRSPQLRVELLKRIHAKDDCRLLLYAGRLAPEKNVQLLLDTMRRLAVEPEDFRLLIAGEGVQRSSLETAAREILPGRVEFLGYLKERDELADLLANCDLVLHPNPREPFGIAPLEAMASGLPLIAPNSGGVLEFADDSNAFLAEPSEEFFSRTVLWAIRDAELPFPPQPHSACRRLPSNIYRCTNRSTR